MKLVKIIILAFFFIFVVAIIFQNQEVFTSQFDIGLDLKAYQIGPYTTSNIVLIAIAFFIGVIFAVIWGALYAMSMRSRLKEKEARIKELEAQRGEVPITPVNETPVEKVK